MPNQPDTDSQTTGAAAPSVVLIVDDNENNVKLLRRLCERAGYGTLSAQNAEQCFDHLRQGAVNAVLLDIVMPGASGLQILRQIRESWSQTTLPVIMVTGMAAKEDLVEAFEIGANDYITKPIDFSVTLARLGTQLKIAEIARLEGRARQAEALNAMIVTYNHEINNPLQVAVMATECLKGAGEAERDKFIGQIGESLDRIGAIMRKIREVTAKDFESEAYDERTRQARLD
jgi:CheY-like chemotaxis protein